MRPPPKKTMPKPQPSLLRWDKHAPHPSRCRVSFWRPVPPPGYVSLGDCMVTGIYAPPQVDLDLDPLRPGRGMEVCVAPPFCVCVP